MRALDRFICAQERDWPGVPLRTAADHAAMQQYRGRRYYAKTHKTFLARKAGLLPKKRGAAVGHGWRAFKTFSRESETENSLARVRTEPLRLMNVAAS